MPDANIDEILSTYRRLHDLCRTVDVSLVAYRRRDSFELLSARLTLGTALIDAKPLLFKRSNWFALRTRHQPGVFARCLEWTTRGRYWEKLLQQQPGEVALSSDPRPWASNGFGRSRSVVLGLGPQPITAHIGTWWGRTFATPRAHRDWVNEIEASDDFHDVMAFVDAFALRQPFRTADEPCQLHAEVEVPLYEETVVHSPESTTVRYATPVRYWPDLKAKWKRRNETGFATVTESDGCVDIVIEGPPGALELSLVYGDQPLAKVGIPPPTPTKNNSPTVLSDRQAADARAGKVDRELRTVFARLLEAGRGTNEALAFRSGLHNSVRDLLARLIVNYAALAATYPALRDELLKAISDRVNAFITYAVAGQRGTSSAAAAREAAKLRINTSASLPSDFDLAIHELLHKKAAPVSNTDASVTVLFLSANPDRSNPLDVEKEQNRITKIRNGSKHQHRVRIESMVDLDLPELAKSLRLHRPKIIHFCGHGGADGSLKMRDQDGIPHDMAPAGLTKLLALQKDDTRLVVLNACYSDELATLLIGDIDCVIGMRAHVRDDAAILFAQSFYGAIFDGSSVSEAFATAAAVVGARYNEEGDIPALRLRAGVNPDEMRLVT